eukprot:1585993-Prymnesium_polylepis.1
MSECRVPLVGLSPLSRAAVCESRHSAPMQKYTCSRITVVVCCAHQVLVPFFCRHLLLRVAVRKRCAHVRLCALPRNGWEVTSDGELAPSARLPTRWGRWRPPSRARVSQRPARRRSMGTQTRHRRREEGRGCRVPRTGSAAVARCGDGAPSGRATQPGQCVARQEHSCL